MKKSDVNRENTAGWTALLWASYEGNLKTVCCILKRGANPNKGSHKIIKCCSFIKGSRKIIKCYPFHKGTTPLILASMGGHAKVVELLLKAGADPKKADSKGYRPIDVARTNRIKKLLK